MYSFTFQFPEDGGIVCCTHLFQQSISFLLSNFQLPLKQGRPHLSSMQGSSSSLLC
jgi:hypothetical protein